MIKTITTCVQTPFGQPPEHGTPRSDAHPHFSKPATRRGLALGEVMFRKRPGLVSHFLSFLLLLSFPLPSPLSWPLSLALPFLLMPSPFLSFPLMPSPFLSPLLASLLCPPL